MRTSLFKFVVLFALGSASTLALADPPARVGRIALLQGQVTLSPGPDIASAPALMNWPVSSGNQITTQPGARAEIRIGGMALQLDGDSTLDVSELDDQRIVLRLHYGSLSTYVRDAELAPQFELSTPQGWVHLREPSRLRVDAELAPDTTVITVFSGAVDADAAGNAMTLRAGKHAVIHNDDVRTASATHDAFDAFADERDRGLDVVESARYAYPDMTGAEELSRYGDWRDSPDYGPLWTPRGVPGDWTPYRDGSWTWIEPWGWTWIDNAPWGYAPFHYGRWVIVGNRWCWAPGSERHHAVWAPALVGWVGGAAWSVSFGGSSRPGMGWYPLGPRDAFVPAYRASPQYLERINVHVRNDHDAPRFHNDQRHDGITVVPHEQFARPGTVVVGRAPHAVLGAGMHAPMAAPPVVPVPLRRTEQRADQRAPERRDAELPRERDGRVPGRPGAPQLNVPQAAPVAGGPAVVAPGAAVMPPRARGPGAGRDEGARIETQRADAPRAETQRADMPRNDTRRNEREAVRAPQVLTAPNVVAPAAPSPAAAPTVNPAIAPRAVPATAAQTNAQSGSDRRERDTRESHDQRQRSDRAGAPAEQARPQAIAPVAPAAPPVQGPRVVPPRIEQERAAPVAPAVQVPRVAAPHVDERAPAARHEEASASSKAASHPNNLEKEK